MYFHPVVSSFFLSFFLRLISEVGDWITSTHGVAISVNLECRSEMCCARLAEIQHAKIAKKSLYGHHPTSLSGYIFATKARIDNMKKTC